ncbi:MAG: hypothetical protein WA989_00510 [Henriciella sp.]|uniref:hypothetical protein n=1 Tax=Henriciella sp. TaxID=1968823 RepID=UPI003C761D90
MIRILLSGLVLAFANLSATAAEDEICRSVSTSWQTEAGQSMQTRVSTQATDGCKRIFHVVDGVETEGRDCNCDLVADGMEARFSSPASLYQARRLLETCHGPSTAPVADTPAIEIVTSPARAPEGQSQADAEQPRIIFRP